MKKSAPLKRILSMCLCLALLLTLLPAAALAVETYTTSDEGIAFIKEFEGFQPLAYSDEGEWYIGYGTLCNPADYPGGIGEAEAELLLRQAVVTAEDRVNELLITHGIPVTQYQFDAMVDLTYNLGTQWINPTYRFCSYLISGSYQYTEAEIVNAIATWCHRGTTVLENLVTRRLREAYLFLYGSYQNDGPEAYTYIHFDPAGGEMESRTVFYPVGQPYGELPAPTLKGKSFMGWHTTAGGVSLTGEELAISPLYATASWDGEGGGGSGGGDIDLSTWVNPYSDVKSTDWFYDYVRELSAKKIVGGYPDGTFQAAGQLKAGEALKLILMAAGYQDPGNTASGHWAGNYLALAESLGCVAAGEITDLDGTISRLTIARITAIALDIQPRTGASPFADIDDGYTLALYQEGILNGTAVSGQRYYYPFEGINRAEMCAIVSRVSGWEYTEKNDPAQSGYIQYREKILPVLPSVPAAPYNRDLFVADGSVMHYNDPAYTTAIGIDVSSHQKEIDWQKVAAAGVEFAFLRLGYRGYGSEGTINLDPYFQQNLTGAKAAGIRVGVYFFSQAITTAEAEEEARFVLENLNGAYLECPVVYDWEVVSSSGARTAGLSNTTLTDCAITFCESVAAAGYTPMIYYNLPVGYTHYQLDRLTAYDVWFAQYAAAPSMYYNYRIWQYSDSGSVPGISGKVDMDLAFIPY